MVGRVEEVAVAGRAVWCGGKGGEVTVVGRVVWCGGKVGRSGSGRQGGVVWWEGWKRWQW